MCVSELIVYPLDGGGDGANRLLGSPTLVRCSAIPRILFPAREAYPIDQTSCVGSPDRLRGTFGRRAFFNDSDLLPDSNSVEIFDAWIVIEQLHIRDFEALLDARNRVTWLHSVCLGTQFEDRFASGNSKFHPNPNAVAVFEAIPPNNFFDRCTIFLCDAP